ncbi:hypothetical protein [Lachnoclostridium sp. An76]|uniref:hypothetical protein n=1 Tax=Lachnoclostridium sp. An76 TaxID=1965654 RepID=UPI000B367958|nr:hypothetical protein [Lachnoclostridium sp. An76]OUN36298.1 hypothetical protein B5G27_03955 [Lachnoclostridium sp. An76]
MRILSKIATVVNDVKKSFEERRMVSIYSKIIRKASYAGSPFIKYYLGRKTVLFILFCLQLISFFTTFAGAKYYLGNIMPFAPAAFTIAIQVAFFVFTNRYSQTERRKRATGFLMVLFCLISATFSYTGLAVSTLPPENEYEKTYNEYVSAAETVKDQLLEKNSTEEEINQAAQNLLIKADSLISAADSQSSSLDKQIRSNEDILNAAITSTTYTDYFGNTTSSTGIGPAGTAAAENIPELTRLKNQITNERNSLSDARGNLTPEQIIDYIHSSDENAALSSDVSANITKLILNYNALNKTLNTLSSTSDTYQEPDQISDTYIEELRNKYKLYTELKDATDDLAVPESVEENNTLSLGSLAEKFVHWLKADSSAEQALSYLNEKKDIVEENYLKLTRLADTLNAKDISLTKLNTARTALNAYGDPNLQAVIYIFDPQYRSKVIGVLILAALVDGLTLILGVLGNSRPLPLLDSKTNREIDNEDHLFSIIFVSLLGKGIDNKLLPYKGKASFKKACIEYVNEIKSIIHKFLQKFQNSPWTSQWGYGLYAKYSDLKDTEDIVPIVSILQQLGYLQLLSPRDFELLKRNYHGISKDSPASSANTICGLDDYICVLRYRVELYLRNSTAEIAMNFIPFVDEEEEEDEKTERSTDK